MAGRNSGKAPSRLGEMFEPPKGLQFEGGFEEAKEEAMNRKLWLVSPLFLPCNIGKHIAICTLLASAECNTCICLGAFFAVRMFGKEIGW